MVRYWETDMPNIPKRILMSDPSSRVGVFRQTGTISLEQQDLRGTDTFVYPRECCVLATLLVWGTSNTISPSRFPLLLSIPAIVRTTLAPKWRQNLLSRGILTARFKYLFWGQNGSILKACKIVTFNARRLELWNGVFDKVNFETKQKQISLQGHFNYIL